MVVIGDRKNYPVVCDRAPVGQLDTLYPEALLPKG